MALDILDLDALSRAELRRTPFRWAAYGEAFARQPASDVFPTDGFVQHAQQRILEAIGKKGTDPWYQHNVETRALLELGESEPHAPQALDEIWLHLAGQLLSPEYRDCLSDLVEADVRTLRMQAHFWRNKPGSWFQPHVDKPHKFVTHLLYLTEGWTANVGGEFRVLSSSDPDDVFAEIPPKSGQSVVLRWSENAWHSVSPVPRGSERARQAVQVWFWKDPAG